MMENIKEIPYGIANFVEVAEQNMYYVDKTMYLPLLEKQPRNLFFIRPRRFLFQPHVPVDVRPEGVEGLHAQIVFDPAGVGGGHVLRHPQVDQPLGQQQVPLVDPLGDLQPLRRQGEEAPLVHHHEAPLPEQAHGPADAGLGEAQPLGHVDGPHRPLLPQGQDGLQVVFRRLVYVHPIHLQDRPRPGGRVCHRLLR